jgi:hypothetical protein
MSDTTIVLSHKRAALLIFAAWAGWLGVLALLGWLGQGTGLMVWPMGEDRNWIDLLMKPTVGETARGLWQIDHRNPLSPWWYIAFKPVILGWPQGLFMLRNLVGLALALSAYGLIVTWLGAAARAFAVTVACLIAIFTANAFFDQIYWNFQVALVCSILCVTCYLRHRREPASGQWLAAALALWLMAIATYTIQTGAIVAIAFAAWSLRERDATKGRLTNWAMGLRDVVAATWPFAVILLLFILIWQTTSVPAESFVGVPTLKRLLKSLRTGFWHPDSTLMRDVLALSAHRYAYVLVGAIVFVAAFAAARGPHVAPGRLLGLFVLVGCLTVPTLLVETVGTQWLPGTRWRMIYQFTTPVFYLSIVGIAAFSLPAAMARPVWRCGVAACFALAAVASQTHNERQVALSASERGVRRAIIADAVGQAPRNPELHYLVLLDDGGPRWFAHDVLSPVYARTWFPGLAVSFRLVPSTGLYAGLQQAPAVGFMDDATGVANATNDGRTIPYAQIRIVRSQGNGFAVVNRLQQSDLVGLRAEWHRTAPIVLARCEPQTPVCR